MSRSTWACELKLFGISIQALRATSRSTWACELKCQQSLEIYMTLVSRSTWACELKLWEFQNRANWWWSRSTWACELKFFNVSSSVLVKGHAPRERVSWNFIFPDSFVWEFVTLHVSVWVEMLGAAMESGVTESRSTWACELKFFNVSSSVLVKVSRSTWACELKYRLPNHRRLRRPSRSTWACELKLLIKNNGKNISSHAPRERVSWNSFLHLFIPYGKMSRSTWACELKLMSNVQVDSKDVSRSTWACELKYLIDKYKGSSCCHAPRERVSWNHRFIGFIVFNNVTLHVSVWVEIVNIGFCCFTSLSRSTWACELKLLIPMRALQILASHAPRERVSWNPWGECNGKNQ